MMTNPILKRKVVITGSCGFIGSQLTTVLRSAGFDVWGIDRLTNDDPQVVQADFLDPEDTMRAFQKIGKPDVVIHLSALSTGTKPPEGYTLETVNITITRNILQALDTVDQFVYFSSITVYGEDGRVGFVKPDSELRPASLYGIGKKQCEEMVLARKFRSTAICRPTPVYSEERMRNMQMRACFPFTKTKIRIIPNPSYSMCHVSLACRTMMQILEESKSGISIRNLADSNPYTQKEIAEKFSGGAWPVFTFLFWPFYGILKCIPGKRSYQLRCKYLKLFSSCLYSTEVFESSH